jgi:anti-sigma B factor antagonist
MRPVNMEDVVPEQFNLATQVLGERRHSIEVSGVIDLFTAPELKRRLLALVDGDGELLVDLTNASYLDSTGLGVLLSAAKRSAQLGGSLVIAGAQPEIARVFHITGLDSLFTILPTREEGLAALDAGTVRRPTLT